VSKIREYDHQIMQPIFWGVTKYDPKYDFLVASDIVTFSAEEVMPSIDEVKKARGQ